MALSTKVKLAYQTPWIPDFPHPDEETVRLMKYEIKRMRQDLVKKQNRMKNNPEFSRNYNERVMSYLQGTETHVKGKTDRQIQNLWNRLRTMETSNSFSISGLKERERHAIESLKVYYGFEDMSHEDFVKFGQFMQWARANYELENIDSDRIVMYYQEHMSLSMEDLKNGFAKWYENNEREAESVDWDAGTEVDVSKIT